MTFDGTQSDATKRMRGYIDGVVATTGHAVPATTTTTALPFIIGDWTTSGLADSLLDDVRIYDSTLTAAQIAALFAGT
jgi:hypothetical protein